MVIRKILPLVLSVAFLGALALTTRPDLHVKDHGHVHEHAQPSDQAHHDEDEACVVCHVLGHFIVEPAVLQSVSFKDPDFARALPPALLKPLLSQSVYAPISRAPPVLR